MNDGKKNSFAPDDDGRGVYLNGSDRSVCKPVRKNKVVSAVIYSILHLEPDLLRGKHVDGVDQVFLSVAELVSVKFEGRVVDFHDFAGYRVDEHHHCRMFMEHLVKTLPVFPE